MAKTGETSRQDKQITAADLGGLPLALADITAAAAIIRGAVAVTVHAALIVTNIAARQADRICMKTCGFSKVPCFAITWLLPMISCV